MALKIVKKVKSPSTPAALEINKVNFRYKFAPDYNPTYANGAHGGISTLGEIILNFYLERQPLPICETHLIEGDSLGPVHARTPAPVPGEIEAIRYVSHGVVLTPEVAIRIRDFLDRQISELQQREAMTKR